jgi:lipoprotein-releasing system permease protein
MDETMTEPQRTAPFAPFEWLLSDAICRRREEGFISVIAGFRSWHHARRRQLIVVMAVLNGFRKELLDKILGLNGHIVVQPLESR